jgi:hypothetical protein
MPMRKMNYRLIKQFVFKKRRKIEDRRRKEKSKLSSVFRLPSSVLIACIFFHISNISSQVIDLSAPNTDTNKVYKILPYKKFSVGIKAGLNVSQVFGAGTQGINHFGFAGGIRFSYRFLEKWSFDPEV